jgi:hypothetical protein
MTPTMLEFAAALCMLSVAVPVTVFFSVKLGTYAYFSGKRRFHETYPEKGYHHAEV